MKYLSLLTLIIVYPTFGLEAPTKTEMDLGPFGPFPTFHPVKREIVCERKPGTDYILCEYIPQNVQLPDLTISNAEITEGDYGTKLLRFNVSLSSPSNTEVKVQFGTIDNTAQESQDYESTSGVVVFPPGTVNQEIHVTIYGDTLYAYDDDTETFFVNLHSIRGAKLRKNQAVGTIINDDMTVEESREDLLQQLRPFMQDLQQQKLASKSISIDLGNDGDEDMIVLVMSHDPATTLFTPYPLSYFVNHEGNGFERVDSDISLYSRFYEAADVNGDGLDDLISVADHSWREVDGEVVREDKVRLLLQTESGELVDSSDSVEEYYARDWHGLTVLDIELDGDIDFVATALNDGVYAFVNDGSGHFTKTQSIFPMNEFIEFSSKGGWLQQTFYTNVHAIDLNSDGYKELVWGGVNKPDWYHLSDPVLPIFRNENGIFKFDYINDTLDVFVSDAQGNDSVPSVMHMEDIDINFDGCPDLLVYQTEYNVNSVISTFESDCNGSLNQVFEHKFLKDGWSEIFFVRDVTGDNLADIYANFRPSLTVELLTNNGDNTYTFSEVDEATDLNFDLVTFTWTNLWK